MSFIGTNGWMQRSGTGNQHPRRFAFLPGARGSPCDPLSNSSAAVVTSMITTRRDLSHFRNRGYKATMAGVKNANRTMIISTRDSHGSAQKHHGSLIHALQPTDLIVGNRYDLLLYLLRIVNPCPKAICSASRGLLIDTKKPPLGGSS